jgi:DNA-binding transcriptional LysR family regulator
LAIRFIPERNGDGPTGRHGDLRSCRRDRSFSAAARTLNVGQPAVSKTVAQLEQWLGVRLLTRSTRGLAPTEAGQSFYDRAKRAIEEADEAELAARGAGASLTGRLRVCAAVTFARLHVVPLLPKFLAAHPGLTLDVVLDDRLIDLVEEGVDLALRMGSLDDSSLTARKISSAPRHVLGTPAYFARSVASGVVRAVLTDWLLPQIDLWAVYPTGRRPTAKARAFAAFVESELKPVHSATE